MHIYEMVNKSPWVSKRRLNEEIIEWLTAIECCDGRLMKSMMNSMILAWRIAPITLLSFFLYNK